MRSLQFRPMFNPPNSTGGSGRPVTAVRARMDCSTKQLLKRSCFRCLRDPCEEHRLQTVYVNSSQTSSTTVIYAVNRRDLSIGSTLECKNCSVASLCRVYTLRASITPDATLKSASRAKPLFASLLNDAHFSSVFRRT